MDPVFIAAAVASAGVVAFFAQRGRRKPDPEPPAPLAEGPSILDGHAEAEGDYVVAPLTKTKCLAFEVQVFEQDAESPSWSLSNCATFSLIAGEAQISVQAAPGTLAVHSKQRELVTEPRLVWDLLEELNAEPSQYEDAWAVESCLMEGEHAYVSGNVRIEVGARSKTAGAYRARLEKHWVIEPGDDGKLSIDWQPQDESSPDEEPELGAGWRQRVAPIVAWMRRHGVTCPSCELTSSRMRYVDDLISDPFLVCRRCFRSFDPPV